MRPSKLCAATARAGLLTIAHPRPCYACAYIAALVAPALGLVSCAMPPAHAAQPAPGARCLLTPPSGEPATVELIEALRLTDGHTVAPGWWIRPPAGHRNLSSVWIVPAAMLSECRP